MILPKYDSYSVNMPIKGVTAVRQVLHALFALPYLPEALFNPRVVLLHDLISLESILKPPKTGLNLD